MASTGDTWRLGHRPALDGLRGVAVLLVLVSHCQVPHLEHLGGVGVTMFFTLSGFLITALLLEERADSGRIRLRAFWGRRARRLLPAYGVLLAAVLAAGLLVDPMLLPGLPQLAASVGYVGNWEAASGGFSEMGGLGHTWSLALEEQFYLAWPLVVVALGRRRRLLMVVTVVGVAVSAVLRFLLWQGGLGADRASYGTDTRVDALLVGGALATALVGRSVGHDRCRRGPLVGGGVAVAVGLGLVASVAWTVVVLPLATALATVVVLWAVVTRPALTWLSASWLRYVGRRSYGIYLYHFPLTIWLVYDADVDSPLARVLLAVAGSLACAALSWRFVEAPAMRLGGPHLHDRGTGTGQRDRAAGAGCEDSGVGGLRPLVRVR